MIKTKLFGMGAAGNKAAILSIDSHVIEKDDVILVNSTMSDIPVDFEGNTFELPGKVGGTGKDRNISKKQAKKAISEKLIDLEKLLNLSDKDQKVRQVIFVTSTDGGSGSGSTIEFANYIVKELKIPVMVCAFVGRARDIRGQRNTVEFFKELNEKITVQIIMNDDFALNENDVDESRIEAEANAEFSRRLSVVIGNQINNNVEQNLDERELYKTRTTPGYMIVATRIFDQKIKNNDQVKKEAIEMLDSLKSPDPDSRDMARTALIYTCEKEESPYMDILNVIKEKFGLSYEVFTHRQYIKGGPRHISVIMAGLVMPMEAIKSVYEHYMSDSQSINKSKDSFFDSMKKIDLDDDSAFDTDSEFDDISL